MSPQLTEQQLRTQSQNYEKAMREQKVIEDITREKNPLFILIHTFDIPNSVEHQNRTQLHFGTWTVEARQFVYPEWFTVENDTNEHTVLPQECIFIIHLNNPEAIASTNTGNLRNQVLLDLTHFCQALQGHLEESGLRDTEQFALKELLSKFSFQARFPIIGISHIGRLIDVLEKGHTWSLAKIDKRVQDFFVGSSQEVSDQFGGTRQVSPEDLRVLFIYPEELEQLLAKHI